MFSFRGDGHKIYLQLRKNQEIKFIEELKETEEIKSFYESLDSRTLQLARYRMIKEQNGVGIIPIFVTAIPWLLFLFSTKLQKFLFKDGSMLWAVFAILYLISLTASVLSHFKEKAWTAFHLNIIQDVLADRGKNFK
ncbi:MAG TPA: hypothetical protein DEO65_13915 [Bacillus bacterium]|uniref:Uncharacterized protein n=1 Tax=Siminovitchia fordii TaxID=254759 RepID=A0ABQ4K3W9_9BACI|nr:hypothetical protein [Siminovitchia fordii]GIN19860.1 hypothetical protein J1TS3_09940 [Siminovitchia fordii]HBZ10944.1 hypothetical protein [Bacillus sp. (in: firmicutes)]